MKYKQIVYMLLLAGSVLLPVSNVSAHDPGLSRSWVQLQHAGLVLRMVFARKDLEVLTPMDTDQNDTVTADEFSDVLDNLQSIVMGGVEVRYASNRSAPKSIQVEQAISDTVNIELYYDYPETSALRVQIPLTAQMVRGHRQYLTVWNASGKLLAQHILSATSPAILLGKSGPDAFGVFKRYLVEGIRHIGTGFDHILFLLTLLLPAVLVVCQCCIDGYSDFNFIRASAVVKRQFTNTAF